jgi:hypothetical protein
MHKCKLSIVAAAFGSAALICAAGFDPAAARITLSQCSGTYNACMQKCELDSPTPPPAQGTAWWGNCKSNCDDNHAACVDKAMSLNRESGGGGSSPPKNKVKLTPPATGLLDSNSGFPNSGPAATGSKHGTPPGGTGATY